MIEVSICGLKLTRLILSNAGLPESKKLKERYNYIHIVTYKKVDLPEFTVVLKKTPIIDLSPSLEEIFKKFKKNTRNEIRKTYRINDLKFIVNDKDVASTYRLYKYVKERDGIMPFHKKEFKQCIYFNAYLDNKMVVSICCWNTNCILRFKSIVSLRKEIDIDNRIMGYATRRLVWEICKYGKNNGCNMIDLGIINFQDPVKAGIAQFKQSFGNNIVDTYIYTYETKLFTIFKKIFKIMKIEL